MSDQDVAVGNEVAAVEGTRTAIEKFDELYHQVQLAKREMEERVAELMTPIAGLVYEVEHGPLAATVAALEAEMAKLRPAMEAEVIAAGKTVKAEHVQIVYTPPGYKWDTKMLDGMVAFVPQIAAARSDKPASVSVKGAK